MSFLRGSPRKGPITGKGGHAVEANLALEDVWVDNYDVLILPGGGAPARLREVPAAVDIARRFLAAQKPVAAICHGPQVLIATGLLRGRSATCSGPLADELREAGVNYVDQELVVDGNLITSRLPSDLPLLVREILRKLGAG